MNHRTFNIMFFSIVILCSLGSLGTFIFIGYQIATFGADDVTAIGEAIGQFLGAVEAGRNSQ